MRKICVINQKGGVGKTTTAINIAAGLARNERKVLLIDMDPQGDVAHSLITKNTYSLYEFLTGSCSHVDCIENLGKNLDVIHSNDTLTKINVYLANHKRPTMVFKKKMLDIHGYDYVVIDCAPSLGLINQSIMTYADEAIIPVSTHYLPKTGLGTMLEAIKDINKHFEHNLEVSHIVPTMHDMRNKSNKMILQQLQDEYGALVTHPIRINAKLAEAPGSGRSIFGYDKKSRGAKDYGALVTKVLDREHIRLDEVENKQSSVEPISLRVQRMMADVEVEE